jgi:hypothetical protein
VPPVGFVVVTRFPLKSVAAQSEAEAHEIAYRALPASISAPDHVGFASPGLVDHSAKPLSSTARHRVVLGHETP